MHLHRGTQYFPIAWPFLLFLFVLFVIVLGLIELRVLRYAYQRMGVRPRWVMAVLLLSLFGSYVNIPVAQLQGGEIVSARIVNYYGMRYIVPEVEDSPGTIIAVNVGGALIPTLLAIYLMFKNQLFVRSLIATFIVAMVTHAMARPVRGVGISVPIFLPPLLAAGVAMILAWRKAPALAYICGTLGTLIGADLMNLGRIQGLGAPIASIGGAGTFDGIFLTGILAVLIAPG